MEIQNADFGIGMDVTDFCTVTGVKLTVSASRAVFEAARGMNGHHGIDVGHGSENSITNFDVQTEFVHDISVEWFGLHTVFSNGRGSDLAMDHHREANYSNLFSNLDCGRGTRPFKSGGSKDRGAHAGAYTTYWNIRAEAPMQLPPADFGPLLNFIGFGTDSKGVKSDLGWKVEAIDAARLCPQDLASAMRDRRLAREK